MEPMATRALNTAQFQPYCDTCTHDVVEDDEKGYRHKVMSQHPGSYENASNLDWDHDVVVKR
jgi:hypothetical protein